MLKKLLENKRKYKRIYSILNGRDHILDFNSLSVYRNIKNFNFRYKFEELNLKIFNVNESLDFSYNMYSEDIKFEEGSIFLDKNSIYYKKLKNIMKRLSVVIIEQDDFFQKIYKAREKAKHLIDKKSGYYNVKFN